MLKVVAIEGLIHAGKTTLFQSLVRVYKDVVFVSEFVEFATCKFPNLPQSIEEARNSRLFFLNLEEKRKEKIRTDSKIVILDRSVLSILAYHFSVEVLTNGNIMCFTDSIKKIPFEKWIFPDLCIYLDINNHEVIRRHQREIGGYNSIFLDNQFNNCLRKFYLDIMPELFSQMELIHIDALQRPNEVLRQTRYTLRDMMGH